METMPARTTTAPTADDLDLDRLRAVARKGQEAAERLAAAEHERQARRTAALVAEQREYDTDLARRGAQVDADLDAQRDEALADLQRAVDDADLGAALVAWRREAAARFAQREWRQAWRDAHERTGEGHRPPPPSLRDAERDEAAGFLQAVARAADSGARMDADGIALDLVGERPTALPGEVLPGDESALEHAKHCQEPRPEVSDVPVGRYSTGRVARCLTCQASVVLHLPEPEPEDEQAQAPGPPLMRQPDAARSLGFA